MNIEEEFDIFYVDMNRLEEQAAEHTFMFIQHSKDLKDARQDLAQAKSELDLVDADIGHWVVKNPTKYKLPEKTNKEMVLRVILRHPKHKRALVTFQDAQEKVNTLQIYVAAYEHRKRMISEAVELFGKLYFAKPYIASSDTREVVNQLEKRKIRKESKPSSKAKHLKKQRTKRMKRERDST